MRAVNALVAVAVGAALCLVGQPVQAGIVPACSWDVGSRTLTINLVALGGSDAVHVGRVPDSNQLGYLTIDDWVPCPSGTVNSANLLVVNGTLASDSVVVNLAGGKLAPGHTAEAKGQSELEVELLLDAGTDNVELRGGSSSDLFELRSTTKAALNGDKDADVTFGSVSRFHLNGAGGNDGLSASNAAARLTGGNGEDSLFGSHLDDVLCGDCGNGNGGPDLMMAKGGNDDLSGGAGRDVYDGGDGADLLQSGGGADLMTGGDGADTFETGDAPDGADLMRGNAGQDEISYAMRSAWVMILSSRTDKDGERGERDDVGAFEVIIGSPFGDVISGGALDQDIQSLGGRDEVSGDNGDDVIASGAGNDFAVGGEGDDTVIDGGGSDEYQGNDGRDQFVAPATPSGDDAFLGGDGVDTMDYAMRSEAMQIDQTVDNGDGVLGESDNVARDIEVIVGGSAGDRIIGGKVANMLLGEGGIDALYGGGGPDELYGGDGDDSLDGQEGSDSLYGEAGSDSLFGADGAADELICGVDGGDVQEYDVALDSVSNCNVPM